ncbi:hypothetical protein SKAU_G00095690 [Synaphobranchus kaupii]|uniref:Uncharacterized protein n=1 Tax=Synaphobranchus kaupii TaxID=118154 RepID=A0A9Q1J6W8_SYNKA|nr:hypothetical protein SKAU_G00095690 [Synaphobranchus kaupii]
MRDCGTLEVVSDEKVTCVGPAAEDSVEKQDMDQKPSQKPGKTSGHYGQLVGGAARTPIRTCLSTPHTHRVDFQMDSRSDRPPHSQVFLISERIRSYSHGCYHITSRPPSGVALVLEQRFLLVL